MNTFIQIDASVVPDIQSFFIENDLLERGSLDDIMFDIPKLGISFFSASTDELRKEIRSHASDIMIGNMHTFAEELLGTRMKAIQNSSNTVAFDESIEGFEPLPPRADIYCVPSERLRDKRAPLGIAARFDMLPSHDLRLCVRSNESSKLGDLERISRRGDMLTRYPYLVRAILARVYGGGNVGSTEVCDRYIPEALVGGAGESAINFISEDTLSRIGHHIAIGPTLFRSHPVIMMPKSNTISKTDKAAISNIGTLIEECREKYIRG